MTTSLSILGSTGSIGRNTLQIIEHFPERFRVRAVAARSNVAGLADQIRRFSPDIAVIFDGSRVTALKERLPSETRTEILTGPEGLETAATLEGVQTVVGAMVGAAGLTPVLKAIAAGKDVALANKETLVVAGDLVMRLAAEKNVRILPIDSEHSAIFQCLQGNHPGAVQKLILTCSGGPFRHKPRNEFSRIRAADALKHPNWEMGKKITIDSATLMNKGLEVIEAHHLFGMPRDRIDVVIHPQSVVHSMVAFQDGSVMAQLGVPDMKTAIAYALTYPERLPLEQPLPDFPRIGALTFDTPDTVRFPCLRLAFDACDVGGSLPAVMNAANEIAVQAFLEDRILFTDISDIIRSTMDQHTVVHDGDLSRLLEADMWARHTASRQMNRLSRR